MEGQGVLGDAGQARRYTDEQHAVITHGNGHAIVDAVPGSGKTTVLLGRVRWLIEHGADPERILSIMFNKSAQTGFQERLVQRLGGRPPQVRTFHSVGAEMNDTLVRLGRYPHRAIETRAWRHAKLTKDALKPIWAAGNKSSPWLDDGTAKEFDSFATLCRSTLETAEQVFARLRYRPEFSAFVPAVMAYEKARRAAGIMFFDDQLWQPAKWLNAHPREWEHFAGRYDHILVDEAQDMAPINFFLIQGLASRGAQVMAVGDGDQAIYSFRGGDEALLRTHFKNTFKPCTRYPMTRTYRFGHALALAANHLIAENLKREEKRVSPAPNNPATTIESMTDVGDRKHGLVRMLKPYQAQERLADVLILGRAYTHMGGCELTLANAGVPYHVYGGKDLASVTEVSAILMLLGLSTGTWITPEDEREEMIQNFLRAPKMYLKTPVEQALVHGIKQAIDSDDRAAVFDVMNEIAERISDADSRMANSIFKRAAIVKEIVTRDFSKSDPVKLISIYAGHVNWIESARSDAPTASLGEESVGAIDAMINAAAQHKTIASFIESLRPIVEHRDPEPPAGDHVHLTSIHKAKGMERHTVVLTGLTSNVFPTSEGVWDEEERRLAYVGMTRAIERLVLVHPPDPLLDKIIAKPAAPRPIDMLPRASQYVYEAELGISQVVAKAIEGKGKSRIKVRVGEVLEAYLADIGETERVRVKVTEKPEAKGQGVPLAGPSASYVAVPRDYEVRVGRLVWHPEYGLCKIIKVIHDPICTLERQNGSHTDASIQDYHGWRVPAG